MPENEKDKNRQSSVMPLKFKAPLTNSAHASEFNTGVSMCDERHPHVLLLSSELQGVPPTATPAREES